MSVPRRLDKPLRTYRMGDPADKHPVYSGDGSRRSPALERARPIRDLLVRALFHRAAGDAGAHRRDATQSADAVDAAVDFHDELAPEQPQCLVDPVGRSRVARIQHAPDDLVVDAETPGMSGCQHRSPQRQVCVPAGGSNEQASRSTAQVGINVANKLHFRQQ